MTPRVQAEWRNRVAAEYRSAALAADVLRGAIAAGAPEALLHTALRIVRDELDHAALSHQAMVALGGDDVPVALDAARLAGGEGPVLARLVDGVVRDFCLGETLAVPLFREMQARAAHPAVVPVLRRILADEAVHRAFGWDALDWLLEAHGEPIRAHVAERLPGWLAGLRAAYAPDPLPEAPPLADAECDAGLLDPARYHAVFHDTLQGGLARRLAARGLAVG
ncbi:MAG: ferritin-like domain-containing protein [Myxococcota bacterium]